MYFAVLGLIDIFSGRNLHGHALQGSNRTRLTYSEATSTTIVIVA